MAIEWLGIVCSAVWVYFDARELAARGSFRWTPFGQAAGTLLIWPIGFPLYLFRRSKALREIRGNSEQEPRPGLGIQQRWMISGLVVVIALAVWVSNRNNGTGSYISSAPASTAAGSVGSTIDFTTTSGGQLSVTLVKVVDPAIVDQYQPAVSAGDVYVGIKFKIVNSGSTSAQLDQGPITALTDSSGQSYSWSIATLADCPSLGNLGLALLPPGGSTTGCVAFEVPTGDQLSNVAVGSSGQTPGIWDVSSPPARYTATILSLTASSSDKISVVFEMRNVGGSAGRPECKVAFTGPGLSSEWSANFRWPSVIPAEQSGRNTLTSGILAGDAPKITASASSISCS